MPPIRTLIIDDEPLARERVRSLLKDEPDIELLAECENGEQAVEAIRKHAPDLIFIDIQMPGIDGFEVLRRIGQDRLPMVVFVTAFDQHALKAFEVHAADYLLKPFKQSRFRETVQRIRERLAGQQSGEASRNLLALLEQARPGREYLTRLAVKTGERLVFVKTSEIEYIEAADNYAVLHTAKENHVLRDTLTALEEGLDPKWFIRVNRSTLVSAEQIKELRPLFKGEYVAILHNGKQFPLTRGVREIQDLLRFS